jgi:hypothetical protein
MGKLTIARERFGRSFALYRPAMHDSQIAQYGTDLDVAGPPLPLDSAPFVGWDVELGFAGVGDDVLGGGVDVAFSERPEHDLHEKITRVCAPRRDLMRLSTA